MGAVLELRDSVIAISPLDEEAVVAKLVEKLRASDAALHERVLRELLPDVRRWVRSLLGRGQLEIDDAVQESLCQIATALHRYEGRSSLRTLARRITVRTTMRCLRRARRAPTADPELDPMCPAPGPELRSIHRDAAERVLHHLARLNPKRRVAFLLCVVEDLTPAEAAREAGCTGLAMRGRLHQARRELRALLEADESLRERLS